MHEIRDLKRRQRFQYSGKSSTNNSRLRRCEINLIFVTPSLKETINNSGSKRAPGSTCIQGIYRVRQGIPDSFIRSRVPDRCITASKNRQAVGGCLVISFRAVSRLKASCRRGLTATFWDSALSALVQRPVSRAHGACPGAWSQFFDQTEQSS